MKLIDKIDPVQIFMRLKSVYSISQKQISNVQIRKNGPESHQFAAKK